MYIRLLAMAALLFCLLAMSSRYIYIRAADTAKLSKKQLTLYQSQSKTLKLKRSSAIAKLKGSSSRVKWYSSNPKIAKVSAKGKVTGVAPGTCTIRAVCYEGVFHCKVKVKAVKIALSSLQLVRGRQRQLLFNYNRVKNVSWTSSDPTVASVDKTGLVQAVQPGTAVITAKWKEITFQCSVSVTGITEELLAQTYPAGKENQGKIILAGSSSMDYWNSAPQAFAPFEVINMAIGGTTVMQWLAWYKTLITRYKPGAVVLYVGSNDLGNGDAVTGIQNAGNTILLLKKISKELPKIPLFYVSVNPCWSREGAWQEIRISNGEVKKYCAGKKFLHYIDISGAFAASDGTPDRKLFLEDQLHPSELGYQVWKQKVADRVKKVLNTGMG